MFTRKLIILSSIIFIQQVFASEALIASFDQAYKNSEYCIKLEPQSNGGVKDLADGAIHSFVIDSVKKFFSYGYAADGNNTKVTHFDCPDDLVVFAEENVDPNKVYCTTTTDECVKITESITAKIPVLRIFNQEDYRESVIKGEAYYSNEDKLSCIEELLNAFKTTLSSEAAKK